MEEKQLIEAWNAGYRLGEKLGKNKFYAVEFINKSLQQRNNDAFIETVLKYCTSVNEIVPKFILSHDQAINTAYTMGIIGKERIGNKQYSF